VKRSFALATLWLAVTAGLAITAGCYGRICESSFVRYGRGAGEGRLVDPDTWESNAFEAAWLPFPRQRVYELDLQSLGDRPPQVIVPYISADENGASFTVGSGNLVEISNVGRGRATLRNGTCADYYLRVVIVAAEEPPGASVPPAPTATPEPDAGNAEGGTP
jgi:hypothetical protein